MKSGFQRMLIPLFIFVWWKSLHEEDPNRVGCLRRTNVVAVKGWRTALVDWPGRGRETISICPLWFK